MINLYYKEYKLGSLSYQNGYYIYNSSETEKEALKNYAGIINYNLQNSDNLKNKEIFSFFKTEFLDFINCRPDIFKKVGENSKNDYEILEKFCKLNFDKFNFWLSNN